MITMQSWMFLSSYEKLREWMIAMKTLSSMLHLGARAFSTITGEVVQTTTFCFFNRHFGEYRPKFFRLVEGNEKEKTEYFFREDNVFQKVKLDDFHKIPGSPVAYWVSNKLLDCFSKGVPIGNIAAPRQGLATSNNERFLRFWQEVSQSRIKYNARNSIEAKNSKAKWFPYNKGGAYKKWYGNNELLVNWEDDGRELMSFAASLYGSPTRTIKNIQHYFKESITWSALSSDYLSLRYTPAGFLFDTKGQCIFSNEKALKHRIMAMLNSKVANELMKILAPTLDFNSGVVAKVSFIDSIDKSAQLEYSLVEFSKRDWDSYETSWDFATFPLLQTDKIQQTIKEIYSCTRTHWQEMTLESQRLEEENNRIFIEAYGLQEELTPDVPLKEITLTCNPHYRYGGNKTEEELEAQLQTDTIKELLSYAIGCMMGRYSLDEPGLIYAHEGNIGFDPSRYKTFPADDDAIIPVMDRDWFEDDAASRFKEFLKTAWPPEHIDENLKFVADSLGPKANEDPMDTIRRYISQNFFKDHLRMYKRRPIYWLFSSGKHKAFECLVYLHRYNESTLARMRSLYVTPLQGNFSARMEYLKNDIDAAASASARKKIRKELDLLTKKHEELIAFDDQLRHLADQKITLDLDDGVKVNYAKFGTLLAETKAVCGK
jgi:type II restriction/modification system DNA methylase subunit YeeA